MAEKIRVAAVSYLNTKPLLYGFRDHPVMEQMELSVDYPSIIAQQLIDGDVDMGLIPVAAIPKLKEHHVISDYCIGAEGPVASVCLYSDVPVEEIDNVFLDYQSRTSVMLARILMKKHWKIHPVMLQATPGYEQKIGGTSAGVVIGDRALQLRSKHEFVYDLAEHWISMTGMPFVFAAWISNKKLPKDFITSFSEATGYGTQSPHLEEVIAETPCDFFDLKDYYTRHISYQLTTGKKKGMAEFLQMAKQVVG